MERIQRDREHGERHPNPDGNQHPHSHRYADANRHARCATDPAVAAVNLALELSRQVPETNRATCLGSTTIANVNIRLSVSPSSHPVTEIDVEPKLIFTRVRKSL